MSKLKCPFCSETFKDIDIIHHHIDKEHSDQIPKDWSASRCFYFHKTGRSAGRCVICKKDTAWNDKTNKYHRFCNNPKCKEKYISEFRQRMIGKHGKITLLNEPDQQKKMLANRKISGVYEASDGGKIPYTGTYELDFLTFLDLLFQIPSTDIMSPSPHVYYYEYEGKKKFYIPDVFIPSLNLEIEIKDGGDNPNNHHKIQAVDKVKEKLKDNVLLSQRQFSYIKIVNKDYTTFFEFLNEIKRQYVSGEENIKPIFLLGGSN